MTAQAQSPAPTGQWRIAAAIFALVFSFHLFSPVMTITDSLWTLHVAESVVRSGDMDLDEYQDRVASRDFYFTFVPDQVPGGHRYSFHPYGTALFVVPAVFVIDVAGRTFLGYDLYAHLQADEPTAGMLGGIQQALACVIVALASVVCYLIGRLTLSELKSIALACIFAFGTSAWSTASRGLWAHGPSMLMTLTALYLLLRGARQPGLIPWAALPLAYAYVIRPTNSIALLVLTLYVAARHRRSLPGFGLGLAAVGALFVGLNLHLYGLALPPYFSAGMLGYHPKFWEALAANLVSPARGLLVYSPVVLLIPVSLAADLARRRAPRAIEVAALLVVAGHWVAISAHGAGWYAGYAYGPRYFADVIPFMMLLLIRPLERVSLQDLRAPSARGLVVAGLVALSVLIHFRGATAWPTWLWNEPTPGLRASVNDDPERVWDWRDAQVLRGLVVTR